jgi:hypothetical protein
MAMTPREIQRAYRKRKEEAGFIQQNRWVKIEQTTELAGPPTVPSESIIEISEVQALENTSPAVVSDYNTEEALRDDGQVVNINNLVTEVLDEADYHLEGEKEFTFTPRRRRDRTSKSLEPTVSRPEVDGNDANL